MSIWKDPCFNLLSSGKGTANFDQLKDCKFPIKTFSCTDIPIHIVKGESEFYVLLRPDNHIVYIGKELNWVAPYTPRPSTPLRMRGTLEPENLISVYLFSVFSFSYSLLLP